MVPYGANQPKPLPIVGHFIPTTNYPEVDVLSKVIVNTGSVSLVIAATVLTVTDTEESVN